MATLTKKIRSNGSFTTITNPTTNNTIFSQGIFKPYSKKLINKAKKAGLKVYTNNKGEVFISIPIYSI
jgi:hypothetical protein